MLASPDPGFGLYVHWPFCQSKCPYCDFNSHVAGAIDHLAWLEAYVTELEWFAKFVPDRVLSSIFFGGGTPSLMSPVIVEGLIDAAARFFRLVNDIEITLEANPTSVEAAMFRGYRLAGVNRVSVGVQALNDADLRALGRMHSADEALSAVSLAQEVFERSSFDLIYARQNQSLMQWESELTRALALGSTHLSLYQLTIEPGTVFHRRQTSGKLLGLPDDDLQADMFELTQDICASAGLPAYEISNHARPGEVSRHNLIYWRGGEWIGVGPGAHGRIGAGANRVSTVCTSDPATWLNRVRSTGSGSEPFESLTGRDVDIEYLMMGLRLTEGIYIERLLTLDLKGALRELEESGYLSVRGGRVATTGRGRPLLNMILRELLVDA